MSEQRFREALVFEAVQLLGLMYIWGERDCSALFDIAYRRLRERGLWDQPMPNLWTGHMWEEWDPIERLQDVQPGDAILYGDEPSHVVMSVTPMARIVIGANNGTSFRYYGIDKDHWHELTAAEKGDYTERMYGRGAMVRIEYGGDGYRGDLLGYRRAPLP